MNDPYVYSNMVLKNKLHIRDYEKLKKAEADIGLIKLMDIDSYVLYDFDENAIKSIHKHIFEDIFSWAGEFRIVPIIKDELVLGGCSLNYSNPSNIESDLKDLLDDLNNTDWEGMDLDNLSVTFARKIALIWRVHPFRDGNTRTILSFAYKYAEVKGFPFDIEVFSNVLDRKYIDGKLCQNVRDKFVLASLEEEYYPEVEYLADLFKKAIMKKGKTRRR